MGEVVFRGAVSRGAQAARSLRSALLASPTLRSSRMTPIDLSGGTGRPQGGLANKRERSPSGA